jgi:elongation factor G
MHVPNPVISLMIKPAKRGSDTGFSKALQRFQREDPTFRVHIDKDSGETIMSGMGELHLDVYVERMKREYKVDVEVGKPQVNFLETIESKANFSYLHKKQSGGSGQFGKVEGWLEPMDPNKEDTIAFDNQTVGGSIPPQYIAGCEKGFLEACEKGPLINQPVSGVRMVVNDGAAHMVDSSELAFRIATMQGFKQGFAQASPRILEPIMNVEVSAPDEFQGTVIGQLNRRKGVILNSETQEGYVIIEAEAPLNEMFGYSTDLRSVTQGKGEFTMEYKLHAPVTMDVQKQLIAEHDKKRQGN